MSKPRLTNDVADSKDIFSVVATTKLHLKSIINLSRSSSVQSYILPGKSLSIELSAYSDHDLAFRDICSIKSLPQFKSYAPVLDPLLQRVGHILVQHAGAYLLPHFHNIYLLTAQSFVYDGEFQPGCSGSHYGQLIRDLQFQRISAIYDIFMIYLKSRQGC